MTTRAWLGLDIGGANLKFALPNGTTRSVVFPLWKQPEILAETLHQTIRETDSKTKVAVTMTGELCDCYVTKADGVRAILSAVEQAAEGRTISVYLTNGTFVSPEVACESPLLAAASNWHALASLAGSLVLDQSSALLLDIGSTTCDLIPLHSGIPHTIGKTDPERLINHELVYTGVVRSPVACLVRTLVWKGDVCPVGQEFFATAQDAYLLLGDLPENPDDTNTADGRPAVREYARDRIARMVCADRTMFSQADAERAANDVCEAQLALLQDAFQQLQSRGFPPFSTVITSGQGEFLAKKLLDRLSFPGKRISLRDRLGPEISNVAPAYAVARLAERGDQTCADI